MRPTVTSAALLPAVVIRTRLPLHFDAFQPTLPLQQSQLPVVFVRLEHFAVPHDGVLRRRDLSRVRWLVGSQSSVPPTPRVRCQFVRQSIPDAHSAPAIDFGVLTFAVRSQTPGCCVQRLVTAASCCSVRIPELLQREIPWLAAGVLRRRFCPVRCSASIGRWQNAVQSVSLRPGCLLRLTADEWHFPERLFAAAERPSRLSRLRWFPVRRSLRIPVRQRWLLRARCIRVRSQLLVQALQRSPVRRRSAHRRLYRRTQTPAVAVQPQRLALQAEQPPERPA